MATYTFSTKPMSRKQGRNAVAAAAYRSGAELADERTGQVHDYTRKRGVVHTEIIAAAGITPPGREQLWNAAEAAEKRRDARVAREYLVALPHELDADQRLALARELAGELVERYGVAVDLAVHAPDPGGDQRNHHAHLLATTRRLNHDGLGEKAAIELSDKKRRTMGLGRGADEIKMLRQRWESLANAALERADIAARINCRSLADQGIDRLPQIHRGPMATEQIRRGAADHSDRAMLSLEIDATNAQRQHLREQLDDELAVQEWAEITPETPPTPAPELPEPEPAGVAELALARDSARRDSRERVERHIADRHQLQIRAERRALARAQARCDERRAAEEQAAQEQERREWEQWLSRPDVCRSTGRIVTELAVDESCRRSWQESQKIGAAEREAQEIREAIADAEADQEELDALAAEVTTELQERPQEPSPRREAATPRSSPAVQRIVSEIDAKRQELFTARQRGADIAGRLLDLQLSLRQAPEEVDNAALVERQAAEAVADAQAEVDALGGWGGLVRLREKREARSRLEAAMERLRTAQDAIQGVKLRHDERAREYRQLRGESSRAGADVQRLESEFQKLRQQRQPSPAGLSAQAEPSKPSRHDDSQGGQEKKAREAWNRAWDRDTGGNDGPGLG